VKRRIVRLRSKTDTEPTNQPGAHQIVRSNTAARAPTPVRSHYHRNQTRKRVYICGFAPTPPAPPIWTRSSINGTTHTRPLTPEQHARYQPWFENTQRLRQPLAEPEEPSLQTANHAERWTDEPKTAKKPVN
jgi:hypothetical protein